jgi:putrescine aminotransferase
MMSKNNEEKATKEEIVEIAARHVCPNRVDTFKQVGMLAVMAKREGNYFWDMDGNKLFDVHINGGTYNLGHRHPELIATLKKALDHFDIGNHHFVSTARNRLAEKLLATMPGTHMEYCVFTTSGSEAVEVALRSARKTTGRRKIASFQGAYHGHGGLSLRAGLADQAAYFLSDQPADEFIQVPFNDLDAMENVLKNDDVAAALIEMIPATLGFPLPSPEFYPGLQKLCRKHGTLFIADEVQTGLGRTGKMWASQTYAITPDIMITGKGLTGGLYPIAAAIISLQAGAWLKEDGWGFSSTSGGSELGCIVALKVLEILGRPGILENVSEMSAILKQGLEKIKTRHPFLLEIRQCGLVHGLVFDNPNGGAFVAACGFESGIWGFPAGNDLSVLQFKPSILIDRDDCREILHKLEQAIVLCEKKLGL